METQQSIVARHVSSPIKVNARSPALEWQSAEAVRFASDWQGKNFDPSLETEVRVLWSAERLYLRFVCRYRELFVFENSELNGRRDHLWDRDVAEAFLQPPDSIIKSRPSRVDRQSSPSRPSAFYKELEVAPNGMWIDLDISPSGLADLKSGLACSVHIDPAQKRWTAELAIPMTALTANFDPKAPWRANFYRVEGSVEPRHYMAWQPTHTAVPNFHVPERFGSLRFEP